MRLSLTDSGNRLTADLGETITIVLPEVGGTGYLWQVLSPTDLVYKATTEFSSASNPGASTDRCFTFTAAEPGTLNVYLARFRPWEGVETADAEFHTAISIRPID